MSKRPTPKQSCNQKQSDHKTSMDEPGQAHAYLPFQRRSCANDLLYQDTLRSSLMGNHPALMDFRIALKILIDRLLGNIAQGIGV